MVTLVTHDMVAVEDKKFYALLGNAALFIPDQLYAILDIREQSVIAFVDGRGLTCHSAESGIKQFSQHVVGAVITVTVRFHLQESP
jgi:hypothetical protein